MDGGFGMSKNGLAKKSHNFKDMQKYAKRAGEKAQRCAEKEAMIAYAAQQADEERKWAAVDREDARQMAKKVQK